MPKIDLSGLKKYSVMFVLLFLMVLFAFASPFFLTFKNLADIVTQNTYVIIVGIGISFVMLGGGIDLSVGYQMSLVGVVTAISMVVYHYPAGLSIVMGILLGTFLGLFNGLIVSRIRVFPLIVTIATSTVFRGISYLLSNATQYRNFPKLLLDLTQVKVLGIPLDVIITLIFIFIASFIYSQTVFGFRLIALGGNEEASRLAGINSKRMKIILYTLCGFCTAIGTMIMLSKSNTHNATFGPGTDILVLTAAIIGGVSFMGGEGNVVGLVAGIFVLAVVGNGMQLAGWGTYAQYLVKGFIFLGAVTFDQIRKNSRR